MGRNCILLRNFAFACLVLATISLGPGLYAQRPAAINWSLTLLFIGLMGTFTNAVLREYEERLKYIEQQRGEAD